jgi:hypothetical protein
VRKNSPARRAEKIIFFLGAQPGGNLVKRFLISQETKISCKPTEYFCAKSACA